MKTAKTIISSIRSSFFASLFDMRVSENTFMVILAVGIGALAGLCNYLFRQTISFFHMLIVDTGSSITGYSPEVFGVSRLWGAFFPLAGALLMLPLLHFFRSDLAFGFPRFLERVNLKGAKLPGRQIFTRGIASAITIGSGGSAGQEGPIAQIGGSVASLVGQALGMSRERLKVLVGCGVAGGVAATFNAPLAGVFFAHEIVLLSSFELHSFTSIVISSGIATVVSRALFGDTPAFSVPSYQLNSASELLFYILMGIALGCLAAWFIGGYRRSRLYFSSLRIHPLIVPCLGALFTGIIAIFLPQVMGNGYSFIELAVADKALWGLMAVLIMGKMAATWMTVGSGLPGGLFAPSLFIGAVAGGSFGHLVHYLFPHYSGNPGAYALVGMGTFLAAVVHAPMTGMFLLFEMTNSYRIIVPIMICSVIGTAIARHFSKESIDTVDLAAEGVDLKSARDQRVMKGLTVETAMNEKPELLRDDMDVEAFLSRLKESRHTRFPLVDEMGRLSGIISEQDFIGKNFAGNGRGMMLKELATKDVVTVIPSDSLAVALEKMSYRDLDLLPVVYAINSRRIVGVISRRDIDNAYHKAMVAGALEENGESTAC